MTSLSVFGRMLLTGLLTAVLAAPAFSQAAEELRQENELLRDENEQLRQQVRDLQKELDDARAKVARLERMVERMQGQTADRDPLEEPEVTIDESKPSASPRALLRAIVESHDAAMGDMEMDRPNSRQRVAYMRALERWVAAAEREFKIPIEWHVEIVGELLLNRDGSARATVVAVDPETDAQLGSPFDVMLEPIMVRRIVPVRDRGDLDKLKMNGVVVPHLRINLERPNRGPFDSPKFIGPYVEYAMDVQVRSIVPVEKPKTPPGKREGQGTDESEDPTPNPRRNDPDR